MINPLHSLRTYAAQPTQRLQQPTAPEAPAQPQQPVRAEAAARPLPGDVNVPLSAAEQTMIERQFPAAPALSMRLYGPSRTSQTVTPGAVGNRLDLLA